MAAVAEARQPPGGTRPQHLARAWEGRGEAFLALDGAGRVVGWNRPAEELFGWAAEEVLGRDLTEVLPTLGPVSAADPMTTCSIVLGRPVTVEAMTRGGQRFEAHLTAWAAGSGSAGHIAVLVHLAEDHDQGHLEQLAGIVECSEDAIIGLSRDGTVLNWNRGADLVYGYAADEMVGQSLHQLLPQESRQELATALGAAARGEAVRQETAHLTKSGPTIEVAVTMSPVRDRDGRLTGASAVVRDITEQRWLARTLDSMIDALAGALTESQEAEARSRRFLADAAHQLRRPLTGLSAAVEALLHHGVPTEHERWLTAIGRETSRASKLVADLLQIARLDQGEKPVPAPCDVVTLCEEEAERTRALVPMLAVVVASELPGPWAEVDSHAVREVLANVLDNARRHALERVEIRVRAHSGVLEIRVADDGPGVPGGAEERIFERFASLDDRGGSGLGLPIARGLARAHGGDLTYELGEFVLRVPWAPSSGGGDDHGGSERSMA